MQVFGALILSVTIGSGMTTAYADTDISSLLTSWFNNKQTESIQEIDQAITAEKNILIADLKKELQKEMKAAEKELDKFTDEEKKNRIKALQDYAKQLIKNMEIDNKDQKKEITTKYDAIIEQAIAQMNGVEIPAPKAAPEPTTKPDKPKENPITEPNPTPSPEPIIEPPPVTEPIQPPPVSESVTEPMEPAPVPEPVTEPIQPAPIPDPPPQPITEPISNPESSSDIVIDSPQANRNTGVEDEKVEVE